MERVVDEGGDGVVEDVGGGGLWGEHLVEVVGLVARGEADALRVQQRAQLAIWSQPETHLYFLVHAI